MAILHTENIPLLLAASKPVRVLTTGMFLAKHKTIVPFGKMMGVWSFYGNVHKGHCFCASNVRSASDLWQLEGWLSHRGRFSEARRQACDAWKATGVRKLEREFDSHLKELANKTGLDRRVLTGLFFLTGTKLFAAYYDHPMRFVENFKDLSWDAFYRMFHQPFKWRWDLIIACYKMPWKYALRRIYPSANPQMLKGVVWRNIFSRFCRQVMRWGQEPGSFDAHKATHRWKGLGRLSKAQWLNYFRRFGNSGANKLASYLQEVDRAREEGIALPTWPNGIPEPDEAHRRHEEIAELQRIRATLGSVESANQHRENWSKFVIPEGWRPLITLEDFTLEGQAQHHCVAGYLNQVGHYFAHLEYKGQQATIQARLDHVLGVWQIDQIKGPCNAVVSEDLHWWAERCLKEMTKSPTDETPALIT